MIIVTGMVDVLPAEIDKALAESIRHVRRSRAEPGCLSHAVHRDVDDPNRLMFFEEWEDMAALQTHFRVPESGAFVTALSAMATAAPVLTIYEATPIG